MAKNTKQCPNIQSVTFTNSQSKHFKYDITVGEVVIYWYDVLKPFYSLTCSHTLYLITNADCFSAIGTEIRLAVCLHIT